MIFKKFSSYFIFLLIISTTSITITDIHLGPNEVYILNSDTNIILCPDTTCSFDASSIIKIHSLVSSNEPITVSIGGAGVSWPSNEYGVIQVENEGCVLEFSQSGTYTAKSIVLKSGSILKVSGSATTLVALSIDVTNGNQNHISIDDGGKLTSKMSTPLSLPGSLDILKSTSTFHVLGDLTLFTTSVVKFGCSGGDAVHVCGRLFVSGSVSVAGTVSIVANVQNPIMKRTDIGTDIAHESLIAAVDRSGTFEMELIDSALTCAGATTSLSWSDFSLIVSTRCADACMSNSSLKTCPAIIPTVPPSSIPTKNGNGNNRNNSSNNGTTPSSQNEYLESKNFWGWFIFVIFILIGFVSFVVLRHRYSSFQDSRIPIPISLSELAPAYHDEPVDEI